MKRKTLALYFLLLFAVGVILRVFVTPLFLPGIAVPTELLGTVAAFVVAPLLLVVVYYLKTQGTPKKIRLFYAFAIGIGLGFPISIVVDAAAGFNALQGTNLLLEYVFSYTIAFIIGIPLSKELQKRTPVPNSQE